MEKHTHRIAPWPRSASCTAAKSYSSWTGEEARNRLVTLQPSTNDVSELGVTSKTITVPGK